MNSWIVVLIVLIYKTKADCDEKDGFYQCKGQQKCIPIDWLCDGAKDCPENDDEWHAKCGSSEDRGDCEAFHFQCIDPHSKKKRCARHEWICDGFIDCMGAIDEVNCESKITPMQRLSEQTLKLNQTASQKCNDDEFSCKNGECIARDRVCDDIKNCEDGSDEAEEKCATPPIKPLIQPTNEMIYKSSMSSIKAELKTTKTELRKEGYVTTATPLLLTKLMTSTSSFSVKEMPLSFTSTRISITPSHLRETFTTQRITKPTTSKSFINFPASSSSEKFHGSTITIKPLFSSTPALIFLQSVNHSVTSDIEFWTQKPFKMSAEMIKERPQRIFAKLGNDKIKSEFENDDNDLLVKTQITSKLEPIHPKVGTPIIPVDRFQVLIPLNAVKGTHIKQSKELNQKTTPGVASVKYTNDYL